MFITAPPPSQAAIRPTGRTPRPSPGLRMQLSRCLLASLHGPVVVVLVGPRHGAAFREAAFVDADHGYRWLFGVAGCALIVGVKLVHGGGELIESVGQRERVLVCRLAVGSHRPCVSQRLAGPAVHGAKPQDVADRLALWRRRTVAPCLLCGFVDVRGPAALRAQGRGVKHFVALTEAVLTRADWLAALVAQREAHGCASAKAMALQAMLAAKFRPSSCACHMR